MRTSVLSQIIQREFDSKFSRGRTWGNPDVSVDAMIVEFNLDVNYKEYEDGYRYLSLAIVPLTNYVLVAYRVHGTLAAKIDWETFQVPEGQDPDDVDLDYTEFDEGWKFVTYHDSCWRSDGVDNILFKFRDQIVGVSGFTDWYRRVVVSDDGSSDEESYFFWENLLTEARQR